MRWRRSEFDVTNQVDVTQPEAVCAEVCRLFSELYPNDSAWRLEKAFADATALFRGDMAGYMPCETPYHDLQHTMDVTLAMTRLLHGCERQGGEEELGALHMQLGILVALFHDAGYMRRPEDQHPNGAAYTTHHVSRSALFMHHYLPLLGLGDLAPMAGRIVHYTGYEMQIDDIPVHNDAEKRLGRLVGTADLLAQMSDRCYLEKCRDRLYYEFAVAGIAGPDTESARFRSQHDLLRQTPGFINHAIRDRMDLALGAVHRYSESFFLPEENPYWLGIRKNIDYLTAAIDREELPRLRRNPPWTLSLSPTQLQPDFPLFS